MTGIRNQRNVKHVINYDWKKKMNKKQETKVSQGIFFEWDTLDRVKYKDFDINKIIQLKPF